MPKKKFIDKKSALHFSVVRRSQRDPLIAADDKSPFVLQPVYRHGQNISQFEQFRSQDEDDSHDEEYEGDEDELFDSDEEREADNVTATASGRGVAPTAGNESAGEAAKYGIMFDDREYDYTQHLKEMGSDGAVFIQAGKSGASRGGSDLRSMMSASDRRSMLSIQDSTDARVARLGLPADLLPPEFEEEVGMLARAEEYVGPQPHLPDDVREVLEALDDEEAFAGELEDDFVVAADTAGTDDDEDADGGRAEDDGYDSYDDMDSDRASLGDDFGDRDGPDPLASLRGAARRALSARLTSASFSSSVLPRTEIMQSLDDRFEKVLEEYEDEEIGELDEENPAVLGANNLKDFDDIFDEFIAQRDESMTRGADLLARIQATAEGVPDAPSDKIAPNRNRLARVRFHLPDQDGEEEEEDGTDQVEDELDESGERWDCESILSTYSNLDNHPGLIIEQGLGGRARPKQIRLGRSGIPIGAFRGMHISKPTKASGSPAAAAAATSAKPSHDTAEVTAAKAESPAVPSQDEHTQDSDDDDDEREESAEVAGSVPGAARSKDETPEERRARKKAVKEDLRARRAAKKSTKVAFKQEKIRQERVQIASRTNAAIIL